MATPDKEQGKERGGKTAAKPARRKAPAKAPPARQNAGRADVFYRALATCRVGSYREAGEIFPWPRFEACPAYLEEVKKNAAKPATAKTPAPASRAGRAAGSPADRPAMAGPAMAGAAAARTEPPFTLPGTPWNTAAPGATGTQAVPQAAPGATVAEIFGG